MPQKIPHSGQMPLKSEKNIKSIGRRVYRLLSYRPSVDNLLWIDSHMRYSLKR